MGDIMERIAQAGEDEIDHILTAAIERKQELYDNWKLLYLGLPLDSVQEYRETLEFAILFLTRELEAMERGIKGS